MTIGSFVLLLVAAALQSYFSRTSVTSNSLSVFGLAVYVVFSAAFVIYAISYILLNLRGLQPSTPGYMRTMLGRIEKERALLEKLQPYSIKQLKKVRGRLNHELEYQGSRISFIFGAASKLGLIPAAFAIYALFRKTQAQDLPYNIDVVLLATIVGLSLGAFLASAVMLKFESMIYVLDEAVHQRIGDGAKDTHEADS